LDLRQNGGLGSRCDPTLFATALAAVELFDSDGEGHRNIDEINASTQPGWTTMGNLGFSPFMEELFDADPYIPSVDLDPAFQPIGDAVETSFEFNATAPFTIGTSPISATFSAGVAETRGVGALYRSGANAWHIFPDDPAVVTFETPASALSFWARTENNNVTGTIRVFDSNNVRILNQAVPNSYELIEITRSAGQALIARFEVTAAGGGNVVIDDLSFTAEVMIDPDPGSNAASTIIIDLLLNDNP